MKKAISLFLALAMLLSLCACGSSMTYDLWPSSGLGAKLPAPNTEKIKVYDYSSFVDIDIYEATAEIFTEYISKCESAGFDIESKQKNDKYEAYNSEGCKLEIDFLKNSEKISINVYESKVNGTISWPSIGLATLIPVPDSNVGTIASNSSTCFTAYIGDTSEEDYRNYVNSCIELGFTVDFRDTGEDFYGNNVEGIELHLAYQGFKTLYIYMKAPENYGSSDEENVVPTDESVEEEENTEETVSTEVPETIELTEEPETTETTKATEANSTSIRADFKKLMDDYEAFMDEYIAFMKKYNESNGSDFSLVAEYAKLAGEYADFVEEIEKWEDEELTDAELSYLLEVEERVAKKLAEML